MYLFVWKGNCAINFWLFCIENEKKKIIRSNSWERAKKNAMKRHTDTHTPPQALASHMNVKCWNKRNAELKIFSHFKFSNKKFTFKVRRSCRNVLSLPVLLCSFRCCCPHFFLRRGNWNYGIKPLSASFWMTWLILNIFFPFIKLIIFTILCKRCTNGDHVFGVRVCVCLCVHCMWFMGCIVNGRMMILRWWRQCNWIGKIDIIIKLARPHHWVMGCDIVSGMIAFSLSEQETS